MVSLSSPLPSLLLFLYRGACPNAPRVQRSSLLSGDFTRTPCRRIRIGPEYSEVVMAYICRCMRFWLSSYTAG